MMAWTRVDYTEEGGSSQGICWGLKWPLFVSGVDLEEVRKMKEPKRFLTGRIYQMVIPFTVIKNRKGEQVRSRN